MDGPAGVNERQEAAQKISRQGPWMALPA